MISIRNDEYEKSHHSKHTHAIETTKFGLFYSDKQTEIGGGWKRVGRNSGKEYIFLAHAVIDCLPNILLIRQSRRSR